MGKMDDDDGGESEDEKKKRKRRREEAEGGVQQGHGSVVLGGVPERFKKGFRGEARVGPLWGLILFIRATGSKRPAVKK